MAQNTKHLRQPVLIEIGGWECSLLTIGHIARTLHRTPWTIRHWQGLDLFPETPFVLNPDVPRTRRRLFPENFVKSLAEIAGQGFVRQRLDRKDRQRFHDAVLLAYTATVAPLLKTGVTE